MNAFTLRLQDATHIEEIDNVTSFVGEDESGSFGILAGHARLLTALNTGMARYRTGDSDWHYLALPGAILSFKDNLLTLSTRHYLRDDDYLRISEDLQQQLLAEEQNLSGIKQNLHQMEQEVLKRLWQQGRGNVGS
ncbi:MAG: F0F1 ATP synthase subunit epsilon [Chromatiales bacterium]|jgi:F-type H+-transporting ATPase subunit epsilon